ncbi:MAG: hypothetical protein ACR2PQ_02645 [Myxococcota bacterium]
MCGWGALLFGCAFSPALPPPDEWDVHQIDSRELRELSGLVKSRVHPGVFWGHNDSGDVPRIFALDAGGRVLGEFAIRGAAHVDWEDIAVDDSGDLYLGDFGNNLNRRTDLRVYRVPEPDPASGLDPVESVATYRFRYSDQARRFDLTDFNYDAEALFEFEGALFIATKHRSDRDTRIYRLPLRPESDEASLSPIATIPLGGRPVFGIDFYGEVTGADACGPRLALLTYRAIYLVRITRESPADPVRFDWMETIELDSRRVGQVEAIAWTGPNELLVGNESGSLFRIRVPLDPDAGTGVSGRPPAQKRYCAPNSNPP